MKLKNEVKIKITRQRLLLESEKEKRVVAPEDRYIILAMQNGEEAEEALVKLVEREEDCGGDIARMRLIQFVLDYSDFLATPVDFMSITD